MLYRSIHIHIFAHAYSSINSISVPQFAVWASRLPRRRSYRRSYARDLFTSGGYGRGQILNYAHQIRRIRR